MSLQPSGADLMLFTLGSHVQGQRCGPARKDAPSHYPESASGVYKGILPSMQLDDRAESLLNPRFPSYWVCDLGCTF